MGKVVTQVRKSGYPSSKNWFTYTQDEHVPQNQTQSHPQWCFIAVGSDNRCNISNVGEREKWLPRLKKLVFYRSW